jgi:phosphoribosyl-ATP pyrophosphohydrolase/phosphoribosyl-AMP cyclohydrolase
MEIDLEALDWDKSGGLIPAIIQDVSTGAILMLAYMNREALQKTLDGGKVTFFSRSRNKLWTKGETSDNYLVFKGVQVDCDADTLLIQAEPCGPACHRNTATCFADEAQFAGISFLNHLERLIRSRKEEMPEGSYTTRLFDQGLPQISKKVGEEAVEVVVSALQGRQQTREETADLLYHLLVFLTEREVSLGEVVDELERRHGGTR